jgi:putative drug exporter of the RND superfamily
MSTLLYRTAHWSVRRRRTVLAVWLVALVGTVMLSIAAAGEASTTFEMPGTESQAAADLLDERFPSESGATARVVFATDDGSLLDDPRYADAVGAMLDDLAEQPGVVAVADPFDDGTISSDNAIGYADLVYEMPADEVPDSAFDEMQSAAQVAENAGLTVEFGGDLWSEYSEDGEVPVELIGLVFAIVVLLLSFGSVVAMGLTITTALIGTGIGVLGVGIASAFVDLTETVSVLAMMLGLAVGIDYALFIVTRHRQNLAEGHDVEEAAARANATAGGAVVFAGLTVVIAMSGLAAVGIPILTQMGLGAAGAVLVAVMIAVTLVPALFGFAGHKIDRLTIGRARTGSAAEAPNTLSARWARRVTSRPTASLAAGLGLMLLLSVPMLSMRLGTSDDGTKPESTTQRQAYDLLAEGFGPGFNAPLTAVIDLTEADDPDVVLATFTEAAEQHPGVFAVGEPSINDAGDTAVIPMIPETGPTSQETSDLVHGLRTDVVPELESSTRTDVFIAGSTAVNIDLADKVGSALPRFMGVVIGLTFILLLVVFRSLVVPIKAAIGILLSISASLGVSVAIFQWEWLQGAIGLDESMPIVSFIPVVMFAVLFGLSMDYEVFILSRIREDYVRTGDARASVVSGLTSSARVITAAALIMISVFASFVLMSDPVQKMFAIGFSTAIFLDATVVRMMIVPAVMAMFDRRAWWLPGWLDRILPNVDVEGEHLMERLEHRGPTIPIPTNGHTPTHGHTPDHGELITVGSPSADNSENRS